jgi:alpha-N-arabinofuranosidase
MDRYDPAGYASLVVDEWGAWYANEPGTNPGFLYQQQTIRDAVLAALTLNVFINHCERVRIANLAQTVNVLQAVALTEEGGGRLVLTPSWDVFAMFAPHQGAKRLPLHSTAQFSTHEGLEYPDVSATASLGADGVVHVTLCNTNSVSAAEISLSLTGRKPVIADARVLATSVLTTCNTFDHPRAVTTRPFGDIKVSGESATFQLPPGSVAALRFS